MTPFDIMLALGVSVDQVLMAVYSGRIPHPDEDGNWSKDISFYLDNWKRSLERKRLKEQPTKNYQSGKLEIPRHTR